MNTTPSDSTTQSAVRRKKSWYSSGWVKAMGVFAAIATIVGVGFQIFDVLLKEHKPPLPTQTYNEGGNVGAIYTGDRATFVFSEPATTSEFNPDLLQVFFSEWQIRFRSGDMIRPPVPVIQNEPILLRLAVQDNNLPGPVIRNIYLAFPEDTEVEPGQWAGRFWVKSNALGVNEYFYQFDNNVPKGEAQFLASIGVSFKSSGVKHIGLHITTDSTEPIHRQFSFEVLPKGA